MTSRFDALIFDFDGVLVESTDVKTKAFATLYAGYGAEIERRVVSYHEEHAGISRFRKFQYFQEVLLGLPYSDADGESLSARFSQLVVDAVVDAPFVAGARELLDEQKGRVPMFVASGTPDGELHEIVQRRGMMSYFVSVHGTPSTKGQIINKLLELYAWDRSRVLMVGDALADLDGAHQAGVCFLGCLSGDQNPFPADIDVIPDLRALPTRL
jgi:phosphoglycolate phosphatase-like HAD superfamily hydrolase